MRVKKKRRCNWCGSEAVAQVTFIVEVHNGDKSIRSYPLCEYHVKNSRDHFDRSLRAMKCWEVERKFDTYRASPSYRRNQ